MERLTRAELIQDHWQWLKWFFILWCISAYGEVRSEELTEEYNLTTTTLLIHWYDTERELQASVQENVAGVSECEWRPDFNTSFCELWLVRPKNLEDEYNFDTIGHELYHALTGRFHDEAL